MEPPIEERDNVKATGDLQQSSELNPASGSNQINGSASRIQLLDDGFIGKYIPSLKEDPGWADVIPLQQDDGVHSIAKINYTGYLC